MRKSLRAAAAAALQQIRRAEFWGSDPHRSRSACRILRGDHCDFAAVGLDGGDQSGGEKVADAAVTDGEMVE